MTLLSTQQEQQLPTCEACKRPIPEGEEMQGIGEFSLCADRNECVERMCHPNPPAREASGEQNEDPEDEGAE